MFSKFALTGRKPQKKKRTDVGVGVVRGLQELGRRWWWEGGGGVASGAEAQIS